jgi:predicted O-methyltransferase YrrM
VKFSPFTEQELFKEFHGTSASAKHLLTIYSLIIGTNARIILDMGLGNSTRAALAAAASTGGTVYSCDYDQERFAQYENEQVPNWRFYCRKSSEFIELVPTPFDFVFHDASHEYDIVRTDIEAIVPKMRRFGLICVHDTQHPRYRLLEAVNDAVQSLDVSHVALPFGCGLSVLRVNSSPHPPIDPAGKMKGERVVTIPR